MKITNIFFYTFLTLLLPTFYSLYGEVESVTVHWNSAMCTDSCANLIEKNFKEMDEVAGVSINASSGVATLKWKPNARFSYQKVKAAMQMVGAAISDIRIRVRGKAKEEGKNIALYSLGDNTRFQIVSPLRPEPGHQAVPPHPSLMELSPKLRQSIIPEAKQGKIIVVEGPLYRPSSAPPLAIVAHKIQIEKKQDSPPTRKRNK